MSKRTPLLALSSLGFLVVAGCGGSGDGGSGGGNPAIPTGTVRFNEVSTDYSGGTTDIAATGGSIIGDSTTYAVNVQNSARTLYVAIPAGSASPGKTVLFDGSVAAAVATYSVVIPGTLDQSRWEAKSGSVTLLSASGTTATIRLNGLRFGPVTGSNGAQGAFTLNGTIVGTPVQN